MIGARRARGAAAKGPTFLDGSACPLQGRRRWAGGRSASNRVDRGGSFDNDASDLRAGDRDDDDPSDADDNDGFRCASSSPRATRRLHARGASARGPMTSAARPGRVSPDEDGRPRPLRRGRPCPAIGRESLPGGRGVPCSERHPLWFIVPRYAESRRTGRARRRPVLSAHARTPVVGDQLDRKRPSGASAGCKSGSNSPGR